MQTPQALRRAVTSWIDSLGYQAGVWPSAAADDLRKALDGLIAMLQFHERDGRGHSRRVARLTLALADELGVGDDGDLLHFERGALLHDIGKLDVPASILTKSAPLDDQEWEVMRRHPQVGYDLLKNLPGFAGAAELVLAHHEAFDGGGYPRGLKGDQIPIGARILSIADAYDSMTHPHTQRPPMPPALALDEIERCSGTQFDPQVAEALGRCVGTPHRSTFSNAALQICLQDVRESV